MGWRFGEYMGTAGDPIPCDLEDEVMSQFRAVHRAGDVAGNPIFIGSDMKGGCLSLWREESVQGQRWRGAPQTVCTHH
jgi:hypothetical protein